MMDFKTATQEFLLFFYFIGLNNFKSNRNEIKLNQLRKFVKLIMTILTRILLIIFFGYQYIDLYNYRKQIKTDPSGLFLSNGELITTIIVLRATYFSGKLVKLFDKIYKIEFIMVNYFSKRIDFHPFRIKMLCKIGFILTPTLLASFMFITIQSAHSNIFNISLVIMEITKAIILIHAIFYIDLIHFLFNAEKDIIRIKIKLLNTNLTFRNRLELHGNKLSINNLIDECYLLKIIHYKICELTLKINKYFGWNLFSIIISDFLRFSGTLYATFIIASNYKGQLINLRKYVITVIQFHI